MFAWLKSIFNPRSVQPSPTSVEKLAPTLNADVVLQEVREGRAVLIDVREPAEWQQLHCDDSASLPLSRIRTLQSRDEINDVIPDGRVVYLHCVMGKRARQAETLLRDLGLSPLAWDIPLNDLVARARSQT
jgi:rhodanese-related sulfurtransferase